MTMSISARLGALVVCAAVWAGVAVPQAHVVALPQQQQPPTFRATADLLIVETQVVDRDGRPIAGLTPADFEVKIGGRVRQVVSADFVQYTDGVEGLKAEPRQGASPATSPGIPKVEEGRMFILVVDEFSFTDQQLLPMMQETRAFLSRLQPEDLVALVGIPSGRTEVNFTRDRGAIERALGPNLGGYAPMPGEFNLSASEIIDVSAGDVDSIQRIMQRECPIARDCARAIRGEARMLGSEREGRARQSLRGLTGLFQSLADVPGRKTVVMFSGGLLSSDRVGGRPDITSPATNAGREAAKANATLYVIHRDDHFLDAMSVRHGKNAGREPNIRDSRQMAQGLEFVAGAANGHLINVSAGTAEFAFSRVLRETSAYYILGVATEARERNGREHYIEVKASASGSTVRHRRTMVINR
jgi:VWFA-related protein